MIDIKVYSFLIQEALSRYKKPKSEFTNINHFVNSHYDNRELIKKYEDGWQFRKQVEWLRDADVENTFIVKYDKNNLINNIHEMCKHNKIEFGYIKQPQTINRTNYCDKYELTDASKDKISEIYADDCILYENLLSNESPFCKLKKYYKF